jgi:hypothetical protein
VDSAQVIELIVRHTAMRNLTVKAIVDGKLQMVAMDEADKIKAVTAYLPAVIGESCAEHDFNFCCDWTTFPGGTVVNTASYKFVGRDGDCRDIISILYDANELKLTHYYQTDMDTLLSDQTRPDTVSAWVEDSPEDGYPVATLVGTPTESGKQIKYRYRSNGVTVESWPETYITVLIAGVIACFVPEFVAVYDRKINKMIAKYSGSKVTAHPLPINSALSRMNRIRNACHGY